MKWVRSDYPRNSAFLTRGQYTARVMPIKNGWEWTTWIGEPGKRFLYQRGEVALESSARRAAKKKLMASDRCFPPTL